MIRKIPFISSLALLLVAIAAPKNTMGQVTMERIFPDISFDRPVNGAWAPDNSGRLFILENDGRVMMVDTNQASARKQLYLDIRDRVRNNDSEQGLLGIAFPDDFSSSGEFYLDYTALRGDQLETRVSRFKRSTTDPSRADSSSEEILLRFDQPAKKHNAGTIHFGPDGYLYIATGDGGWSPNGRIAAQELTSFMGKMLRIDVSQTEDGKAYAIPESNPYHNNNQGYLPEIYAYGFRNPWLFSFDRKTGTLWLGDVGNDQREEIDTVRPAHNYGWPIKEGTYCFRKDSNCNAAKFTDPIFEMEHDQGQSINGGYVYRGSQLTNLKGDYIFGDFMTWHIRAMDFSGDSLTTTDIGGSPGNFTSFIEDGNGELYILTMSEENTVYRLAPQPVKLPEKVDESHPYQLIPNPTGGTFRLDYPQSKSPQTLALYDLNGKLIFRKKALPTMHNYKITNLASGAYLLRITEAQNAYWIKLYKE